MSFVHKDPNPLRTPQEVAGVCLQVARERGLDDFAAVLAVMCITAETGFWCPWNRKDPTSENYEHDSESDDGRSVGYFQQQNKTAGEIPTPDNDWWGPMAQRMGLHESCNEFLSRLEDNYMEALEDPVRAGEFVQHVQGSAFPDGSNYRPHYDSAAQLVNAAASGAPPSGGDGVGFAGDPVWLEDVLREALGDRLVVENDGDSRWDERGTGGTMGDIWGVMIHHTGNDRETVNGIKNGRPDLAGPLSQGLITPDGKFHLIAVGPCNHAGIGTYPGVGQNLGNQRLIGFECAWPTIRPDGTYNKDQKWPDAQIITMRDATAAVLKKLGYDGSHVIGHKEYAFAPPNVKWDPGNIDMGWFRGEVQKDLDGFAFPGEQPQSPGQQPPANPTSPPGNPGSEVWDQVAGRWEMLGWRTVVEELALIGDILFNTNHAGKTGFTRGAPPDGVDVTKP